nr:MAG TPA: hypothetical protein [Bacteriophage sp.]
MYSYYITLSLYSQAIFYNSFNYLEWAFVGACTGWSFRLFCFLYFLHYSRHDKAVKAIACRRSDSLFVLFFKSYKAFKISLIIIFFCRSCLCFRYCHQINSFYKDNFII